MTSRERYIHSIKGGPIDRFFRTEFGLWTSTRELWIKDGYPADADFREYFDMDPMEIPAINSGFSESPYYPRIETQMLEETEEYVIEINANAITTKTFKVRSDTSMPQFLKFPVTARQDWERMRQRLNPEDAPARIGDTKVLTERCSNPDVPIVVTLCGAFGHPRNLLGDEGLSYIIFDDPGLLHEILENWCELYVELLAKLTSVIRVDGIVIWEDMCYRNGPLISPRHFRTFMLPRYKQVIQAARAGGVECIAVDSDGDVRQMIPIFLEAGVDALMPFEVQAGMDVVKIREDFGGSFCIIGGINKRALARDRKSIEDEVNRVVPYFLKSGRYIPSLDHMIPTDVSFDSFRHYLHCLRQYERF